jgi:hypothetical protein
MVQRLIAFAALIVLACPPATLRAHEPVRIVGTITTFAAPQLGVKTKQGRTVYVEVKKTTVVVRDKTRVPVTALKPGLSVVVDAHGDDDSDLTAKQVRIVAASPAPAAKGTPR